MAKRINFWELPVEDAQPDDTVPAYRGRGQVARVRLPDGGGGEGTVTSVGVSMPTGFVVANSPVTSSGTIAVTFSAGYSLPTTAKQGQWDTAYGWGNHALAGYALASTVTSALAGKVDTSDARLTNSREWTASTVSQAEAEAGTATTRRAWTAQRVWQAIAAWWSASAAKSKLDGIQAGATANQTDAYLLNRANHTGTQAASTITGLAAVATTGSYNDLTGKPAIPAAQVPADWNATSGVARILNKPTLGTAAAANTGDFATAAQGAKADTAYGWGNHASAGYALSSSLAAVATSGSYDDLSNKPIIPTLPAAVSQAEAEAGTATTTRLWTAQRVRQAAVAAYNALTSVFGRTLASASDAAAARTALGLSTVAQSGSYNDLSNKPTLGTAAAANTGDFATAAQGAKADTALQPAAIGVTVQGYSAALNGTTASFTTALKNKLDGIEAGATGDQTAAEILALLKTVDGSGSGLDADAVDGYHVGTGNNAIPLTQDVAFHSLARFGVYIPGSQTPDESLNAWQPGDRGLVASSIQNSPGGEAPFWWVETQRQYSNSARHQVAIGYSGAGSTPNLVRKERIANGDDTQWSDWATVWTSANFDPSSKANVSHTHSASDITSGTLSDARLPSTQAGKTFTSPIQVTGTFDVDGSGPGQQQNGLYIADLGGTKGTTNNPTYTTALAWQTSASRSNAISVDDQGRLWAFRSHSNAGTYTFRSRVEEADKLTTARTINGTSFNGTGNITTANWGTARTLTVGSTGKSVNGGANVSWSLAEIGAAPASTTYSKTDVNTLLAGYVTPAAMSAFTYDKATIDNKIYAGSAESVTLAQAQAIALYF